MDTGAPKEAKCEKVVSVGLRWRELVASPLSDFVKLTEAIIAQRIRLFEALPAYRPLLFANGVLVHELNYHFEVQEFRFASFGPRLLRTIGPEGHGRLSATGNSCRPASAETGPATPSPSKTLPEFLGKALKSVLGSSPTPSSFASVPYEPNELSLELRLGDFHLSDNEGSSEEEADEPPTSTAAQDRQELLKLSLQWVKAAFSLFEIVTKQQSLVTVLKRLFEWHDLKINFSLVSVKCHAKDSAEDCLRVEQGLPLPHYALACPNAPKGECRRSHCPNNRKLLVFNVACMT